ncbi:FAD-dependent oxidoreductase [Chlorella sorokiniana]|uniref:L-2-hydroxyglutarate dehydrogenase, mitochondrial n=1 Tax=Chlorella sorokiniana TaxID=3076 RepID=A0A2P6TVZ2_CHLSO|nr:FAD-dependent oxidoreductase [Chlorella sorokiniana]|eukprot:PRW58233.1 FAD-dependent oxidoreductase [Chlorella sorokiniana]
MAHLASYSLMRGQGVSTLMAACAQRLLNAAAAAGAASSPTLLCCGSPSSRPCSSSAAAGPEPDTEVAVIGAGVVGLAIARQLALAGRAVLLLEAAGTFGTETSSRNSEVIHAGLYYPAGSLKARLCVAGKQQLYAFCKQYGVPHRRLGKLLVASSPAQLDALSALAARAAANGVSDLRPLSKSEVGQLEPAVRCEAALLSPSTGIIDSHSYMAELHRQFEEAGGTTAFYSRVVGGAVAGPLKRVRVQDANSGEETELTAGMVVNAAGLHAQAVAADLDGLPAGTIPPLHLAKGSYFSLAAGSLAHIHGSSASGSSASGGSGGGGYRFRHLVYPLPEPGTAGLGTHLTLDLAGGVRFGPDVEWLPPGTDPRTIDYSLSPTQAQPFYAAIRAYLPGLPDDSLEPSYSGVRPKVVGPGQPAGDFVVQGPAEHGVPGLVNLYGIESPGLTASLALAQLAAERLLAPDH